MQRIEEALQSGQRLNEAVEQFQAVARRAAALVVQHFDEALLRHRSGLNGARINPYAILGVERTATREEIKAAYRSLMRQHHPDRASALGDAQARELAHRRAQEIVLAYQMLSRQVR
jgi:DnaJ-class molecular chaperone